MSTLLGSSSECAYRFGQDAHLYHELQDYWMIITWSYIGDRVLPESLSNRPLPDIQRSPVLPEIH
jgi:hypothetical protein